MEIDICHKVFYASLRDGQEFVAGDLVGRNGYIHTGGSVDHIFRSQISGEQQRAVGEGEYRIAVRQTFCNYFAFIGHGETVVVVPCSMDHIIAVFLCYRFSICGKRSFISPFRDTDAKLCGSRIRIQRMYRKADGILCGNIGFLHQADAKIRIAYLGR